MEQSNLLDLAKQGEPDAIAALMNAVLEPKGITAHAEREHDCLNILLESPKTLNRETLTAFIQKGLLELGTDSIRTVRAQGKKLGTDSLSWTQELELYPILPDDLLWLDDPDAEPEEPEAPIELKEDSHLWLEDFEVELPPEPAEEEAEEESEAGEEPEEPPSGFFSSLKTYWLAYSLPIMLVVVGAFLIGGVAAFLSTSKAAQNRVEEVMPTPDEQPPDEKQQRAEAYLKAMNTAQEKFYQQNNRFANSLEELERSANLMAQSYDYAYRLKVSDAACEVAPCTNRSLITASPREAGLKSYIGGVFATETGTTVPVICQTQKPSMDAPLVPEFSPKGEVSCAPRSAKVQ